MDDLSHADYQDLLDIDPLVSPELFSGGGWRYLFWFIWMWF